MIGPAGVTFLLLATISVTYSISIRRLESLRRALAEERVPDLLSIWTFAAVLILPTGFIPGIVIIAYAAEWPSRNIVGRGHPLRYLYSCGSAVGTSLSAAAVFHATDGSSIIRVGLAALTFSVVDIGSIVIALLIVRQSHVLRMFTNPRAHVTELSCQCLGGALAALLSWHLSLGLLVVPAILLVHRWSLRETVKVEEAFDETTGLWSETAWRVQAHQKLHDAQGGHVALIIIDPEEPGADPSILEAIGSGLSPFDLLGRYGTRQIVVLMSVGRAEAGKFMSTGFRADLARAGVQAALGCATTADSELEGLLIEAMSDLMAKRAAAGVHRSW